MAKIEENLELYDEPTINSTNENAEIVAQDIITRVSASKLSYNDFYWLYMKKNCPVVIKDISTDWECRRNWTMTPQESTTSTQSLDNECINDNGVINFDYLRKKMGNASVPVADYSKEYYNSHAKIEMPFYDFLDYWENRKRIDTTDDILTDDNNPNRNTTTNNIPNKTTEKNLYLKDWHLKAQMPDYEFYQVPKYFASDWLNEQLIATGKDDYRFVYMGPKGSWTPFHADVFGSYSWSNNIVGCKQWTLLPPGEELKLMDNLGNLPFRIDTTMLAQKNVRYTELLQHANEAIFVPSGWYHQVINLDDTISVNHNWFNACNIMQIWHNLATNMQKVIAEIDDCRQMDNFDEHCQMMLRASFGINYLDFLETLEFITTRRLSDCCGDNGNNNNKLIAKTRDSLEKDSLLFEIYRLNEQHNKYDLESIRLVLEAMVDDAVVANSRTVLLRDCLRLLEMLF